MTVITTKPKTAKPQPEKKPIERIYTPTPAINNNVEDHKRNK